MPNSVVSDASYGVTRSGAQGGRQLRSCTARASARENSFQSTKQH